MKARYLVPLLMFFVLFSSVSMVSAKEDAKHGQSDGEINARVATYNIQAGLGMDGDYDLDRLADTIRDMDADVVGLNEVDVHWDDRSNYENTVKKLAEKLGMEYYFAPIYDLDSAEDGDYRRQYGVALLSDYPIEQAENREITRLSTQDSDSEPEPAPGFLEAEVDIDGASTWFYVSHLDYRGDPSIRETQVGEMLDIMGEHDFPILMGDMNAEPDAPELQPLFDWFDDAWMNSSQSDEGYTFPADDPVKRIDYILTSKRMATANTTVNPSQTSDHYPVFTDVTMADGGHSLTTEGTKTLVDAYQENGEITSETTAHKLSLHLRAIHHYEKQDKADKVVKHLQSFQSLIETQKEKGNMSEHAYSELTDDAGYLIEEWDNKSS